MNLNSDQQKVFDECINGKSHIFCTGEGGTGKSWLISHIVSEYRRNQLYSEKQITVTASTGLAAFNIKGMTLHSFAGIQIVEDNPTEMIRRARRAAYDQWISTDILIIDEISMVSATLFDNLSIVAKSIRESTEPFGGIRIIMFGDFLQLSPVSTSKIRKKKVFESDVWKEMNPKCFMLSQIIRQKDTEFKSVLSSIRSGICDENVEKYILGLSRKLRYDDNVEPVTLFSLRISVDGYNHIKLDSIKSDEYKFHATDSGDKRLLKQCVAPPTLTLKTGAQVMIIRNMSSTIVNGSVGTVTGFEFHDDTRTISPIVSVVGLDGICISTTIEECAWETLAPDGKTVLSKRIQIPLILAWATTIHKSQGMTIPRLSVDLEGIFDYGQVYVALSRAVDSANLQVLNFTKDKIKADPYSISFYIGMKQSTGSMPVMLPVTRSRTMHIGFED